MGKIFILYLALVFMFFSSCATSLKQEKVLPMHYKTGSHISYPQEYFIVGHFFDKKQANADLFARREVANKITSSIKAESSSVKKAYLKNASLVAQSEEIKQYVQVHSQFQHNEYIEVVDRFFDGQNYFAFAVLNRKKYAEFLEAEMAVKKSSFEKVLNTAKKHLEALKLKDFKAVKSELLKQAIGHDAHLLIYSKVLKNPSLYSKQTLKNAVVEITQEYEQARTQTWKVIGLSTELTKNNFMALVKQQPKARPWVIRSQDQSKEKLQKNAEVTRLLFNALKKAELNVNRVQEKDLQAFNEGFNMSPEQKHILVDAQLIYKCSYDQAFYYCRTGVKVSARVKGHDLFTFVVEGASSRKTKAVDIHLDETLNKSIKKLEPYLQEKVQEYVKDFKS